VNNAFMDREKQNALDLYVPFDTFVKYLLTTKEKKIVKYQRCCLPSVAGSWAIPNPSKECLRYLTFVEMK
jgi:hypothetical protein